MIRQAEPEDLPAVLALLTEAKLPTEGVAEHLGSFFVYDQGGRIVATSGLELHGDAALLRSLAVAAAARGSGLGAALLRRALHEAHGRKRADHHGGGVFVSLRVRARSARLATAAPLGIARAAGRLSRFGDRHEVDQAGAHGGLISESLRPSRLP